MAAEGRSGRCSSLILPLRPASHLATHPLESPLWGQSRHARMTHFVSRICEKVFKNKLARAGICGWGSAIIVMCYSRGYFLTFITIVGFCGGGWPLSGVRGQLCGVLFSCIFIWVLGKKLRFSGLSANALSTEPSCWPWMAVLYGFLLASILESLSLWMCSVSDNHRAHQMVGEPSSGCSSYALFTQI